MRRARLFLALAATAAVALSGVGAALSATTDGSDLSGHVAVVKTPVAEAPAALASRFAVLRAATVSLPDGSLPDAFVGMTGVNLGRAVGVPIPSARRLWIAPADNGFCFIEQAPRAVAPGAACTDDPQLALSGGIWETYGSVDKGADLVALLPDGIDSATVHYSDGHSEERPVQDNVLFAHLTGQIDGYSFKDDAGEHTVKASVFDG